MKVEISKDGIMKIKAETSLEAYALKCWSEENEDLECKNLIISWDFDIEKEAF